MKKPIEQIKVICSKIKRFWTKIVAYVCKRAFVLTFPLVVFTVILLYALFMLYCFFTYVMASVLGVWIIVFLNAKYIEE